MPIIIYNIENEYKNSRRIYYSKPLIHTVCLQRNTKK